MTSTEKAAKCQQIIDLATELRDATIEPDPPPPVQVAVPSVVGATIPVAKGIITDAGLVMSSNINDPLAVVSSQSPLSGAIVASGSTVTVVAKLPVEPPVGTTINVGPAGAFQELHKVPFHNLQPNTTVNVVFRGTPYRSKLTFNRGDLHLKAIPGPAGELVEINANDAVENAGALSFSTQIMGRGIITIVQPTSNAPVRNVKIEGFDLTGARRTAKYTDKNGSKINYGHGASGIAVYTAENVEVIACKIHDNEDGIFAVSNDGYGIVRNIAVRWCNFFSNGCGQIADDPNAIYLYHNSYIEADGATYEFNTYGPLVPWSAGCLIKDRSAGAIVRYNSLTGSVRHLDLVDPEAGENTIKSSPRWGRTDVYSNLIKNTNEAIPIHFGFDGDAKNTQLALYFYFNTCIDSATRWKASWFKVHGSPSSVRAGNNIFHNASTEPGSNPPKPGAQRFYTQEGNGTYFHVMGNFVTSGTIIAADSNGNPLPVGMDGWNQQTFGTDPGLNADLTLKSVSVCKGKTVWPTGWPIQLPTHGWTSSGWAPRSSFANIGASQ